MFAAFNVAHARRPQGGREGRPRARRRRRLAPARRHPAQTMNVYLLEDEGGGVTLFDAGIRPMTHAIAAAAAPLGGINRVVLGHADADHRGARAGPRRAGAVPRGRPRRRGGRRRRSTTSTLEQLDVPRRAACDAAAARVLGRRAGGDRRHGRGGRRGRRLPASSHLPGHAPGADRRCSASRDRLALVERLLLHARPADQAARARRACRTRAFNQDTEQARASIRKLAALEPAAAWPGHADPLTGDVRAQLERAATA